MVDGVVAVLTGGRQDPWGYDVRAEIFGSGDSVSVGLDGRTPLRSVEPGAAPPARGTTMASQCGSGSPSKKTL